MIDSRNIRHHIDVLRDLTVLAVLPGLFRVSLSGPSLEFENRAAFFQGLTNTSGNATEQIGTVFIFLLGAILIKLHRIPPGLLWRVAIPFIPFLVLAFLSIAWSDYPDLTFRRCSRLILEMLGVIAIAISYAENYQRLFKIFLYFCLVVTALNFLSVAIPSRSFSVIGFNGIHPHKLETARFFLFALPIFLLSYKTSGTTYLRAAIVVGVAIIILLLPLTRAKTAWIAIPLGLLIAWQITIVMRNRSHNQVVTMISLCLACSLGIFLLAGLDIETILDRVFGDSTLTGRDAIWRFAFDKFRDNEILGVGYGGLWQTGPEVANRLKDGYKIYVVNQAHSGYVDVLVQTGICGTLCLAIALLAMLRSILLSASTGSVIINFIALHLFVAMLVINLTDTTYFWANSSLWSLPVFFYSLSYAIRIRNKPAVKQHERMNIVTA